MYIFSYLSAAFSSDSEHQEYKILPAAYSVSLLNSRVLLNAESSLMQYSFKWIVVSRDSMPQHSCFYRQKISLPLFGMWGAWGCPLSHRHCLCSDSVARAMTSLIAERSDSRGMHLSLYKVYIVEKIPLSQSRFWTSSTVRDCVFHCTCLRHSL